MQLFADFPVRVLSYGGSSQYELRQEYSFLWFSKAFIALQAFIYHKFHQVIFFCVFDGFLKKEVLFLS